MYTIILKRLTTHMHIPHENEESNFGLEGTKVTES